MLAAGAVAGITAGLFGVGGGFIVVPALLTVFPLFSENADKHIYVAIGTSLATIIVSSVRAVQAHHRRGAVDFVVLKNWAPWLLSGVLLGLSVASVVDAGMLVMIFAVGVLAYAFYFLSPNLFTVSREPWQLPSGVNRAALASGLGGLSALLGIGGGTPFVVTMVVCGRPVHQAVATAAGVGFVIAVPGTMGFLLLGFGESSLPPGSIGYINLPALLAVSIASVFTAPLGAKWAHNLDENMLKRVFGIYLLGVAGSMFYKSVVA
jgi:uncharacterized membrane protein YfcA